MDFLLHLDKDLFNYINQGMSNAFLSWTMPYITDLHTFWFSYVILIPLIIIWILKKKKTAIYVILQLIIALALADAISYRVIKPHVNRLRPEFQISSVILRTKSHSGLSFPSNHAANAFAAAVTLSMFYSSYAPIYLFIASVIAFSRIYVGVHFPLDVLGGAALGTLCAILSFFMLIPLKGVSKSQEPD